MNYGTCVFNALNNNVELSLKMKYQQFSRLAVKDGNKNKGSTEKNDRKNLTKKFGKLYRTRKKTIIKILKKNHFSMFKIRV